MPSEPLDCVIVGYHDVDLQPIMAARAQAAAESGGFRQMLGSVFRYGGRWRHHVQLLDAALEEATGRPRGLHTMELPNLAVSYLHAYLARRGFSVGSVNFFTPDRDRLAALLRAGPRAVAITTTLYFDSEPVREIVAFVRRHAPDACIVAGGPHIHNVCGLRSAIAQDRFLADMGADVYVNDSQGEAALARLLSELRTGGWADWSAIANLAYPGPGGPTDIGAWVRTARAVESNDLDAEAIDWSLLPAGLCRPTAQMRISRSCPFACSFCRYPALAGPSTLTGIPVIEREMRQLRQAGASTLIFVDDTPNVPAPRFKQMLRMMIDGGLGWNWFSNFRCSNADPETYDLLQASGCRGVFLGIESGDQGVLDNMHKQASVEKYRDGIRRLKERGILTYASFVVGFPGETRETALRTLRFIEETQPDYYQLHLYYHSRNVPIHRQATRFGLHGSDYSWRHNTMDWREAADLIDHMRRTISGPVICGSYLSSFWLVAYLHGKGVSFAHIRDFMERSRPLLLRNAETAGEADGRDDASIRGGLVEAARAIAADLQRSERAVTEDAVRDGVPS